MAGKRISYLCVVLACTVFYLAYQEWLSWLALVGVLGLPWLSLLVSLPGIRTFRAEIQAPDRVPVGVPGDCSITGFGRFVVMPFFGRIRLTRTITGETWKFKDGGELPTEHCGALLAELEKVRFCDVLGLFRFRGKRLTHKTILVWPKPQPPEDVPDLSRYLARAWRPKPGGGFAENHEMRLYRPGDSLNQVHWKLTAKTGQLIIREPMEPQRDLVLLTMDISGAAEELDRKFGRLLWLGDYLLEQGIAFEVRALAGEGILAYGVAGEEDLETCLKELLCASPAGEGSIRDQNYPAAWQYHVGGGGNA